ncbi:hypothetical protein [Desulfovibrio desulfuricans]|uniref:hypothetical protein n=1 Tax=Desulfovibrio desulfuricans TaxID=876 RepID=UPI0003B5DA53|nr:hypothetical protein [Desulfovibrio desulfuricans]
MLYDNEILKAMVFEFQNLLKDIPDRLTTQIVANPIEPQSLEKICEKRIETYVFPTIHIDFSQTKVTASDDEPASVAIRIPLNSEKNFDKSILTDNKIIVLPGGRTILINTTGITYEDAVDKAKPEYRLLQAFQNKVDEIILEQKKNLPNILYKKASEILQKRIDRENYNRELTKRLMSD